MVLVALLWAISPPLSSNLIRGEVSARVSGNHYEPVVLKLAPGAVIWSTDKVLYLRSQWNDSFNTRCWRCEWKGCRVFLKGFCIFVFVCQRRRLRPWTESPHDCVTEKAAPPPPFFNSRKNDWEAASEWIWWFIQVLQEVVNFKT